MSRSPIPSHEEIDNRPVKCQVCGKEKTFAESMPAEMVRDSLARIIRRDVPVLLEVNTRFQWKRANQWGL